MVLSIPLPSAQASVVEHADWLEYYALRMAGRPVSMTEFSQDLNLTGTEDALDTSEDGDVPEEELPSLESTVESAFDELHDRFTACGGEGGAYPFELDANTLQIKKGMEQGLYAFLLLLSRFGLSAHPEGNAAKLFEDISSRVVGSYLGAPDSNVSARVFGFPRHGMAKAFPKALDDLCRDIGEGGGHRATAKSKEQKDAKLDIVAWRHFADRRPGKLIAFAQCATGNDWQGKLTELHNTRAWCQLWIRGTMAVAPIRCFCVPHRVDVKEWEYANQLGGILFERCRIAELARDMDADLCGRCASWANAVLQKVRLS